MPGRMELVPTKFAVGARLVAWFEHLPLVQHGRRSLLGQLLAELIEARVSQQKRRVCISVQGASAQLRSGSGSGECCPAAGYLFPRWVA